MQIIANTLVKKLERLPRYEVVFTIMLKIQMMKNTFKKDRIRELEEINTVLFQKLLLSRKLFLLSTYIFIIILLFLAIIFN